MDYGDWKFNHPVKATLLFAAIVVPFVPASAGLAWLLSSLHWVSGDNVAAGLGLGVGGALVGIIVGLFVVHRVSLRYERRP